MPWFSSSLQGHAALHRDRFVSLPTRESAFRSDHIPEEGEEDMYGPDDEDSGGGSVPLSPGRVRAGAGGRHWGRITVCGGSAYSALLLLSGCAD